MDWQIATLLHVATTAELLQLYIDAETRILAGQSVRYGERMLTLADLQFVQRERARLQAQLDRETSNGGRGRGRFSQADFSGCSRGSEGFTY